MSERYLSNCSGKAGLDLEKRTRGLCRSRRLTELLFVLHGTEIAERRVPMHRIAPLVDEVGDLALSSRCEAKRVVRSNSYSRVAKQLSATALSQQSRRDACPESRRSRRAPHESRDSRIGSTQRINPTVPRRESPAISLRAEFVSTGLRVVGCSVIGCITFSVGPV